MTVGVDRYTYIMFGVRIDGNPKLEEDYFTAEPDDFRIIFDDLWADMKLGHVLYDSGEQDGGGFVELDISPRSLVKWKDDYTEKFKARFPDFAHLLDGEWKLMSFELTCA